MLYLIKDSRGAKILVKVGLAKDIEQRMRQYNTCNPLAKLLQTATCQRQFTDRELEKLCHLYFKKVGYKNINGTEWYLVPKGRKDYYFEDIEKELGAIQYSLFQSITKYKSNPLGRKSDILKERW